MSLSKRAFLKQSVLSSLAFAAPWPLEASSASNETNRNKEKKGRKFTMQLNGGLIGVNANQVQLIDLAYKYGFETVAAYPHYLAKLSDQELARLLEDMKRKKIAFGVGNIAFQFREKEDVYRKSLIELPALASALQRAGVTRAMTWIRSFHSELNYLQNFRQHAVRLRETAAILNDYGIRFGIEYLGSKALLTSAKYPFIHTLAELQELIAAIGQPNVGIHLDTAHWFAAGESLDTIRSLTNKQLVGCDIDDALPGYEPIENQPAFQRELPAATGIIDTKGFLEALVDIGYDGFIQAEPFNEALNQLDDDEAVRKTAAAMKKAFSFVGG
ncbi:MAG: sugar phosphate isomerase/epimerase [Chitinophagaceae bacterium]|nr:sugar phosphate isomerase/epimerase [Chitinophagaceae bacterium]